MERAGQRRTVRSANKSNPQMNKPSSTSLARRRECRVQRGAAMVEFALVGSLYLLLLMAILEFAILFSVNLTMQYAVREGARAAVVGQPRVDVIQRIQVSSMGYWGKVSPVISVATNGGTAHRYEAPLDYNDTMFGNAGDLVALQIDCSWPLLTPLMSVFFHAGVYQFTVGTTMRNEAF